MIKESIRILNKAIDLGGSTIKSYHAANSVDGKFQNSLLVYGRNKETCVKCNSLIYKSRLGGRGTHFCPTCQKSKIKNRVIGITGLIGSGKSTVSSYFMKGPVSGKAVEIHPFHLCASLQPEIFIQKLPGIFIEDHFLLLRGKTRAQHLPNIGQKSIVRAEEDSLYF